jgi:MFS family permease
VERSAWSPGQRLITAGLVFMTTAVGFEGLAVPTVLPAALDELGGLQLYGWAFAAFWLTNLVGITVAGHEADRRGPLTPFLVGTLLFAAGLALAGAAPTMGWVVIGRVVQGLGAGAIASITFLVIARGYARAAQPRVIAITSSAWVLPGILGPAAAGYVAQELSWRWAFLGLAPLLPLAAVLMVGPMRTLRGTADRTDGPHPVRRIVDAGQLATGAGLLLAVGNLGQPLLAIAVATVGAVLIVPPLRRLLPRGTLSARPGRGAVTAVIALISAAFFGAEAFIPLTVSSVRGAGTLAGGLALTTAAVSWAAGSWIQDRLEGRGHRAGLTAAGVSLIALGIGVQAAVAVTSLTIYWAAIGWAVAGLGMGVAYSLMTLTSVQSAPPGGEGAASAAIQLSSTLGVALGTGAAGSIVALGAVPLGLAPAIAAAQLAMLVVCGMGIVASGRLAASATPLDIDTVSANLR